MRHMKKLLFALLTVMLCLIVLPAAVAEANGMIRVKLTALGMPSSVTMKTNCDYVYEGGMNIPSEYSPATDINRCWSSMCGS